MFKTHFLIQKKTKIYIFPFKVCGKQKNVPCSMKPQNKVPFFMAGPLRKGRGWVRGRGQGKKEQSEMFLG